MADISDSEGLEAWLNGKSPGLACVLAARASLRAAPVLSWALRVEEEDRRRFVVLTSFRALAAASFAGAWLSRAAEIRNIARGAGRDARESVSDAVDGARMGAFEAQDAIPEIQELVWRLQADTRHRTRGGGVSYSRTEEFPIISTNRTSRSAPCTSVSRIASPSLKCTGFCRPSSMATLLA